MLPRRRPATAGAFAGVLIAALDLGLVGRRIRAIRELPVVPQVVDHIASLDVVERLAAFPQPPDL